MLNNLRQVHVPGGILDMRTIYLASHLQKRKSYCHLFSPCLSSSHVPALVPVCPAQARKMMHASGLFPFLAALYGVDDLPILYRESTNSSHANDTTNYLMHEDRKVTVLSRNGFKGRSTVSRHTSFEDAREIIIKYELPLREQHLQACKKFGELHAKHLPFNPALITEWHGNIPSRSRMIISECLLPFTGLCRRTEAEAAVYSGSESPFAEFIMKERVAGRLYSDSVRS